MNNEDLHAKAQAHLRMQLPEIPPNVMCAAKLLESYFAKQGIKDWCLMGVCSRSHAERLAVRTTTLPEEIEAAERDARA